MKKKLTFTAILGLIANILWLSTLFLRNVPNNNDFIVFILGIMPNITAPFVFLWFAEYITNSAKKDFSFKIASISSVSIFVLGLISEIIHDKFLNSPFDINDIIATIVVLIIYLIFTYLVDKKNKKSR